MDDNTDDAEEGPVLAPLETEFSTEQVETLQEVIIEESTSAVDEDSNDSIEPIPCETCGKAGSLTFYKKLETGSKPVDIYRHLCHSCHSYFGMCCKKVRGCFSYVTEEGRTLTKSERAFHFGAGRNSSSQSALNNIETDTQPIPSTSNGSEEVLLEKNPDEGIDEKMDVDDLEENEAEKEYPAEDVAEAVEEDLCLGGTLQKKPASKKKPKKHAFVGGKAKKPNWGRRKSQRKAVDGPSTSVDIPAVTETRSVGRPAKTRTQKSVSPVEEPKARGRPLKNSQKVSKNSANIPSTSSQSPSENSAQSREFSCQTENDLLLSSLFLEDAFNKSIKEGFGEQISSRLKDQPLILRKQFIFMLNTIHEQEKQICRYKEVEEKYCEAAKKLKDFGRSTRLSFSDEFRCVRADLLERKDEFKTNQAELISMFIKERATYEEFKTQMLQKFEDQKLENSALEAKIQYLEQDLIYEKDKAEFYLRTRDEYEKERSAAVASATEAQAHLEDRLWLGEHERCTGCQTITRQVRKMEHERDEAMIKKKKAEEERDEAVKNRKEMDKVAQTLGVECDNARYERDTFKASMDRQKKENQKLTQSLAEKEKELLQKINEVKAVTPKASSTPRSVACTPSYAERITPPEDGEIIDSPPQRSPVVVPSPKTTPKPAEKPLIQKIVEKKAPVIATGFASWIPKDKIDEPAPEIPTAVSAFEVPLEAQKTKEPERPKFAPLSQPTPWEKASLDKANASAPSNSLSETMARVRTESFAGVNSSPAYVSKTYTDEMNRMMNSRKRASDVADSNKNIQHDSSSPPIKKNKPVAPSQNPVHTPSPKKPIQSTPAPSAPPTKTSVPIKTNPGIASVGSLTSIKKIPKLSEKPPQAEFAPALGLATNNDSSSIPGLNLDQLDEKTREEEKAEMMKIKPAASKPTSTVQQSTPKVPAVQNNQTSNVTQTPNPTKIQSPQKKKKNGGNKNTGRPDPFAFAPPMPWQRNNEDSPPWNNQPPARQQQYGIQSNQQRCFQMDLGLDRPWSDMPGPPRSGERQSSFSSLPWHRDRFDSVPMQDTPFGKVPIQDNFASRPMLHRPPQHPSQSAFYNNPHDNNFFHPRDFSPPQPPHQSRMFSPPSFGYSGPPNNGPRSFYSN
ncbi:hypothetical protein L5515_008524 [Caenorhabditis briggsae]|uniref:Uncharacterized protein n=1 Tax=Caenorhabditis briggsae TaxID=6238 RepID=A0AAE9F6F6_CAEBR|nr:hypothetical protein L5515_008524 [Caenorhabditis briggsae]